MAKLTLPAADVRKLVAFCLDNSTTPFFAKDEGAYFGASVGATPDKQCLFYFTGCNPAKAGRGSAYDNASRMFGGDDFGQSVAAWLPGLTKLSLHPRLANVTITASKSRVSMQGYVSAA